MQLYDLLIEKKGPILNKWIDLVLASYPADASKIFKKQKDRFANPVGYNVSHCLTELYAALVDKTDLETVVPVLEELVKVRAVQTFSPSDAISFVYIFKQVIKEQCDKEGIDSLDLKEWFEFESRIDVVAYTVFDLYMASRERLYQIRINELKSGKHIITDGGCPSTMMRKNKNSKAELKTINIHS